MNPFARTVIGYHGCGKGLADRLLSGDLELAEWEPSTNDYDWLGHGVYFWEHSPSRAFRWASERAAGLAGPPAVIGAIIQLGRCFDLTDEQNTQNLSSAYDLVREAYQVAGKPIPENRGSDSDLKGRYRDCLVINYYLKQVTELDYQTVRCPFAEGAPAYDGAMIRRETHVQVAVRDLSCILGVFRPTYGL